MNSRSHSYKALCSAPRATPTHVLCETQSSQTRMYSFSDCWNPLICRVPLFASVFSPAPAAFPSAFAHMFTCECACTCYVLPARLHVCACEQSCVQTAVPPRTRVLATAWYLPPDMCVISGGALSDIVYQFGLVYN